MKVYLYYFDHFICFGDFWGYFVRSVHRTGKDDQR